MRLEPTQASTRRVGKARRGRRSRRRTSPSVRWWCGLACVTAFSGTDAPSDVNRLPQSSSTAGPVRALTGVTGACAVSCPLGTLVMSSATRMPKNGVSFIVCVLPIADCLWRANCRRDGALHIENAIIGRVCDIVSSLVNFLPSSRFESSRSRSQKSFRRYCKFFADCLQAVHGARKSGDLRVRLL